MENNQTKNEKILSEIRAQNKISVLRSQNAKVETPFAERLMEEF